jgi:hypothetical protein
VVGVAVIVEVVVAVGGVGGRGCTEDSVLDERLEEGALGCGLVTLEGGEGALGVAREAGEEVGGGTGVGERLEVGGRRGGLDAVTLVVGELLVVAGLGGAVGGFDLVAVLAVGEVEEVGFGLCVAAEFPAEECDAFDEEGLEGGLGIEVVVKVVEEVDVVGLLGLGDEVFGIEAGAEAVAEGVEGGAGFAVGCAGAGGAGGGWGGVGVEHVASFSDGGIITDT